MESLNRLVDGFLDDLGARRRSRASMEHARTVLSRLLAYLEERNLEDARAVTEADLAAFARWLALLTTRQGTPLAAGTVAAYLGSVRSFFAFLVRCGVILADPARDLPLPKVRSSLRHIPTRLQMRRLMDMACGGGLTGLRNRAILELLYGTGLRLSECVRLELRDLDLSRQTLFIRDGKGKKDRVVPFAGRAAAALLGYLTCVRRELIEDPREVALFLSRSGKRLAARNIQVLVGRVGKAAGIAATPHLLRHACATHLLQGGAGVRQVQELLGHKRLETTGLYTRVLADDLRAVLRHAYPERKVTRRKRR